MGYIWKIIIVQTGVIKYTPLAEHKNSLFSLS